MPLAGGPTDKIGNRYEGRWTVQCMIDVLEDKARSIQLEKAGEDGFEFILRRESQSYYHQVKRQNSGLGHWTIGSLENNQTQVLSNFWEKLSNQNSICVFVSTQDADQLGELAQRSKDSSSFQEFKDCFLTQKLSGYLDTLRKKWSNCGEEDAYKALKQIQVETVGENFLKSTVESRLSALFDDNPTTVRLELIELSLEKIHQELSTYDIWHHLTIVRGYRRREWGKDSHVLARVEEVNQLYSSALSDYQSVHTQVIPRNESLDVYRQLIDVQKNILLVGEAGIGKSGVMLKVVNKLRDQGIPFLAFRVDRLEPALLPAGIGKQLKLPSESPAIILANIAQNRECVLIIDQLDAVSLASGRNPQFFECVHQVIKQAQAHPNIRLLLACRKFDLDNDSRLQQLAAQNKVAHTVTINPLSQSEVEGFVKDLGFDSNRLNHRQIKLLSLPLHLTLLAEISQDNTDDNKLGFETAKDLYNKFWQYKQYKLREKLGQSVKWTQVIDVLCSYMSNSQNQTLSAPESVVDEYRSDAEAMASEHILVWEDERIRFFHESFFDYAFARRFSANPQSLLTFLGNHEQQHLFRRAQLRQILLYERETNFEKYLEDLRQLLTSPGVRFHLKEVVISSLGLLGEPHEEEWKILSPLLEDATDPCSKKIWGLLRSSPQWFQCIDTLGVIESWLNATDDKRVESTVSLLSIRQENYPERVAELMEPFVGMSEIWSKRLPYLLKFAKLHINRHFFDLFLKILDLGILDDFSENHSTLESFWWLIYDLPKHQPDWACEAIGHYLNRHLALNLANEQPNPFDSNTGTIVQDRHYEESISESARLAPEAFVDNILPFMLCVMEATAIKLDNLPWKDKVWGYRIYGRNYGISHELLTSMELALSELAIQIPNYFREHIAQNLCKINFETAHFLIIRTYTSCGHFFAMALELERILSNLISQSPYFFIKYISQLILIQDYAANNQIFANDAIAYICENESRLRIGYSGGNGNVHAAPYWATYQLLQVMTQHCSRSKVEELENLILSYHEIYEKSSQGRYFFGYPQMILIDAIDSRRRSFRSNRRLQELKRKFISMQWLEPSGIIETPKSIEAQVVPSPIPESATDKMTDEQWLRAIKRYDYSLFEKYQRRGDHLIGGASELSHVLARKVEHQPKRFINLIHQFSDTTNVVYFNAVLRGLAETTAEIDLRTIISVCQRCHQLPEKPCGQSISWLFHKKSHLSWPPDSLDILLYYAINDPDPEQESWRTQTTNGDTYYNGDIHSHGINCTRGSAASAIAALIFADKNRVSHFQNFFEKIVTDSSLSVRSCAAEILTATLNYDRDLAVDLFLKLCNTEEILLGSTPVEDFLRYGIQTHFHMLKSIIEQMLQSIYPNVIEAGSRQACRASLIYEEAIPLAEFCLNSTEIHRKAASEIFNYNFRYAHFKNFSETALIQLFNDLSSDVQQKASDCFNFCEGSELGDHTNLILSFVQSTAFAKNSHNLVRALKNTTAKLPLETLTVCEYYVHELANEHALTGKGYFRDANSICHLLIKIYSQNTANQSFQAKCLNLIDQMTEIGVYGLDSALQEYER